MCIYVFLSPSNLSVIFLYNMYTLVEYTVYKLLIQLVVDLMHVGVRIPLQYHKNIDYICTVIPFTLMGSRENDLSCRPIQLCGLYLIS